MTERKPGYGVRIAAVFLLGTLPYAFVLMPMMLDAQRLGLPWHFFMGNMFSKLQYLVYSFGRGEHFPGSASAEAFWDDKFANRAYGFQQRPDGEVEFSCSTLDPETGQRIGAKYPQLTDDHRMLQVVGPWIWLIGRDDSLVLGPDHQKRAPVPMTRSVWRSGAYFMLGDCLSRFADDDEDYSAEVFVNGRWRNLGPVELPELLKARGTGQRYGQIWIQCVYRGEQPHFFLKADDYFFYREGVDWIPQAPSNTNHPSHQTTSDDSVKEKDIGDAEQQLHGWTRISLEDVKTQSAEGEWAAMFVSGEPAIAFFENLLTPEPTVRVCRRDGLLWPEIAAETLRIGSCEFKAYSCEKSEIAYVVSTTSMGLTQIDAVTQAGFRETRFNERDNMRPFFMSSPIRILISSFVNVLAIVSLNLAIGMIYGLGVWWVMSRYSSAGYEFGVEIVALASIGWRGLARLIDLILIILVTWTPIFLIGWSLDWMAVLESLNLGIEHPAVSQAKSLLLTVLAVKGAMIGILILGQALWGVTPGKWICGLRTVRTSMRRCGIASSLAREFVMMVDCCNFLCWIPGILSIALTDHRQRLGDLVADTIVINKRSRRIYRPTREVSEAT